MQLPGEGGARFTELWPLHRVRYGLLVAGVATWLWERSGGESVLGVALLLSLLLAVELPLHGPAIPRAPLVGCALQAACAAAVLHLAPGLSASLVLCAVLAGAGAVLRPPASWTLFGVVTAACAFAFPLPRALGDGVVSAAGWALSTWLGRLFASRLDEIAAHRRTVAELEAAQARLARMAEAARELAAAQARERLASAVHDALGHALIGTLLQVQLARKLAASDREAAEKRLDLVEASLRETLGRVRRLLAHGRHDREHLPLHLALEGLVADMEAVGGPEVHLRFKPDAAVASDVDPEVSEAIYRCVQEALTNAVRHGKASRVDVGLEAAGGRLYVRIADDGEGAARYTPGMGLSGMIRRIQTIGGTLRFHTSPGEGFQIEIGVKRR